MSRLIWPVYGSILLLALCLPLACSNKHDGQAPSTEAVPPIPAPSPLLSAARRGELLALTYNVAGLPAVLSRSRPDLHMSRIGQLLNRYDVVLLQESWQTPTPNPYWPVRFYHELLVSASRHPYKTEPEPLPLGGDPRRPSAWVSDGLHTFSRYPFASLMRQQWPTCFDATFNDCRAFKGFSMARIQLAQGAPIDVYNLHMEAGRSKEDHAARAAAIEQLIAFATKRSSGQPMIIGGDFNLRSLSEPGTRQWKRLLHGLGLQDACAAVSCAQPGRVDRFVFRSGPTLRLTAKSWASDAEVFVDEQGNALSDHEPIAVRFAWSLR